MSWQQRLSALCDAACGLAHLHASRMLHRDDKTGSILHDGSLQPLQTAGGTLLVYRAFLSDVGLAKVREASAGTNATMHATTRSLAYSLGSATRSSPTRTSTRRRWTPSASVSPC
jgi:serine/threonine protein kinase